MVLILGIAIISALVHNAYVCNGHKLHIPPTDAPIGRNANNAPEADSPGLHTVYAPKADALHVSQTDTPTGRSADDFPSQADNPSGMNMSAKPKHRACLKKKLQYIRARLISLQKMLLLVQMQIICTVLMPSDFRASMKTISTRYAFIELYLHISFGERQARWTTINHTTNTATMRFSKRGHPKFVPYVLPTALISVNVHH